MAQIMSSAAWVLGSGAGIGLFPVAPATWASLAAVIVYGFSPIEEDSVGFFLLCGLGFLAGIWACQSLITDDDHVATGVIGHRHVTKLGLHGHGTIALYGRSEAPRASDLVIDQCHARAA